MPLVKVKQSFLAGKLMTFIYIVIIIFAILLCATFYIMNYVGVGGSPNQELLISSVDVKPVVPPVLDEKTKHYLGEIKPPNLDLLEKLRTAKSQNTDTVGWINIPSTNIDYPVLQTDNHTDYDRRGFDGRQKFSGHIYMDSRNVGYDRFTLYKNTIIYGHNINTNPNTVEGDMFAELMYFRDVDFANKTPYIYYITENDNMMWEIFSVFYADGSRLEDGSYEFYYIDLDLNTDENFLGLMNEAVSRSEYDYGVEINPQDKILTLSTCAYTFGQAVDQRFVVMGRLVSDNSIKNEKSITLNEDKKIPPIFAPYMF